MAGLSNHGAPTGGVTREPSQICCEKISESAGSGTRVEALKMQESSEQSESAGKRSSDERSGSVKNTVQGYRELHGITLRDDDSGIESDDDGRDFFVG